MHYPLSEEGARARVNLIYAGPLDADHRVGALADAFLAAREHDPRLHLLVVGDGPERLDLKRRLGSTATFISVIERPEEEEDNQLDELLTRADMLVCPTTTADTAKTIVAAQARGLPVLAVEDGEAAGLIQNGRSGFLVPAERAAFADAIRWLSRRATLRQRLSSGGRFAARTRHASDPGRIMTA